jgi:hypothetical protein
MLKTSTAAPPFFRRIFVEFFVEFSSNFRRIFRRIFVEFFVEFSSKFSSNFRRIFVEFSSIFSSIFFVEKNDQNIDRGSPIFFVEFSSNFFVENKVDLQSE